MGSVWQRLTKMSIPQLHEAQTQYRYWQGHCVGANTWQRFFFGGKHLVFIFFSQILSNFLNQACEHGCKIMIFSKKNFFLRNWTILKHMNKALQLEKGLKEKQSINVLGNYSGMLQVTEDMTLTVRNITTTTTILHFTTVDSPTGWSKFDKKNTGIGVTDFRYFCLFVLFLKLNIYKYKTVMFAILYKNYIHVKKISLSSHFDAESNAPRHVDPTKYYQVTCVITRDSYSGNKLSKCIEIEPRCQKYK